MIGRSEEREFAPWYGSSRGGSGVGNIGFFSLGMGVVDSRVDCQILSRVSFAETKYDEYSQDLLGRACGRRP